MMKLLIILSFVTFSFAVGAQVDWLSNSGQKKMIKTFEKVWKDKKVELIEISIPVEHQKAIGVKVRSQTLFHLVIDGQKEGYVYLDKASSKFDQFDYMVIYNKNLIIKLVKVLVYREDQGAEIMSSSFLKQFQGKSKESTLELGVDVQGISGATISCRATVNGVKKLTGKINKLSAENQLNK